MRIWLSFKRISIFQANFCFGSSIEKTWILLIICPIAFAESWSMMNVGWVWAQANLVGVVCNDLDLVQASIDSVARTVAACRNPRRSCAVSSRRTHFHSTIWNESTPADFRTCLDGRKSLHCLRSEPLTAERQLLMMNLKAWLCPYLVQSTYELMMINAKARVDLMFKAWKPRQFPNVSIAADGTLVVNRLDQVIFELLIKEIEQLFQTKTTRLKWWCYWHDRLD